MTRILKESFESTDARNLCVIACVAPNATDTGECVTQRLLRIGLTDNTHDRNDSEHTIETLRTISTICGVEDKIVETKSEAILENAASDEKAPRANLVLPKQWNPEQLKAFLVKKKLKKILLKPDTDGKSIMKMSTLNIKTMLVEGRDAECAKALFDALRNENDRVNSKIKAERKKTLEMKKRQRALA